VPEPLAMSLRSLCDYFGISNEGAHSALVDARRTAAVYRELCRSFR
jgi:DNA polymerase III epsilon subunit-like protein